MTRVGYVGPLPPIRSGIAHHGASLVAALRDAGHAVTATSWHRQYPRLLYRRAERAHGVADDPTVRWMLRWWDPLSWVRAGRRHRGDDVLVTPWTVPVHAPHVLALMRAASVPTTIVVHNALPHESMPCSASAARAVLRRADHLVTHAASVAQECAHLAPGVPVSVVAMPPLLPVVRRPLPSGPLRLLVLGHIREYKGADVALRAMRRLVDAGHDVTLTIAGEPWDGRAEPWVDLVASLGIEDRVRLDLAFQTDARMSELIADHHVLLAPYRSATQSGTVAQALAQARPVVATRVGGLPDMVHDGENGALCRPGDEQSLCEAIERVASALDELAAGATRHAGSWDEVARVIAAGAGERPARLAAAGAR